MTGHTLADRRALSRAVSQVENRAAGYEKLLAAAYAKPDWATVIGITGPPGAGKSTLVDVLAAHWGEDRSGIAVLAIDPSSPFSGGAVLGDRIRMEHSDALPNVYFRSLSARGNVGGLSEATCDLIALLNAHGFQRILVETVGAGQSDVEITGLADCTLVVAVPGLGDSVQALKAGIMEIADVYAVNKSDLPDAPATRQQIETMLSVAYIGRPGVDRPSHKHAPPPPTSGVQALMRRHGDAWSESTVWRPPVIPVCARSGIGIGDLSAAIDQFISWSRDSGRLRRKRELRIRDQILRGLTRRLLQQYRGDGDAVPTMLKPWVDAILAGTASLTEAIEALLARNRND
jgi:LAO/AO transport system kinase